MTAVGWIGVVAAGWAAWLWVAPAGLARLDPVVRWRLPRWARPVDQAMASSRRWLLGALSAGLVVWYGWGWSSWLVVAAPAIAGAVWVGLGRLEPAAVRRRRTEVLHQLPAVLDLARACLLAGQPLRRGIETVGQAVGGPVADRLELVSHAISVGMSEEQAWLVLAGDPVLGPVARDLARCSAWGTPASDVLAQHSGELRQRSQAERRTSAKAVGVKTVLPLGLCYLPAFLLVGVAPVLAATWTGFFA
jgi:Flp pilus assembly protein TadB